MSVFKESAIRALSTIDYPILECMRNLLSDRTRWTKKAYAKRTYRSRNTVDGPLDPEAGAFCLMGAYGKCVEQSLPALDGYMEGKIVAFNDDKNTRHKDILDALDKAMQRRLEAT